MWGYLRDGGRMGHPYYIHSSPSFIGCSFDYLFIHPLARREKNKRNPAIIKQASHEYKSNWQDLHLTTAVALSFVHALAFIPAAQGGAIVIYIYIYIRIIIGVGVVRSKDSLDEKLSLTMHCKAGPIDVCREGEAPLCQWFELTNY